MAALASDVHRLGNGNITLDASDNEVSLSLLQASDTLAYGGVAFAGDDAVAISGFGNPLSLLPSLLGLGGAGITMDVNVDTSQAIAMDAPNAASVSAGHWHFDAASDVLTYWNSANQRAESIALSGTNGLTISGAGLLTLSNGATPPSYNPINGTSAGETLSGTVNSDAITAGAGDDELNGSAGNDFLWGGDGNDTFYGGTGDDNLDGGGGDDSAYLGNGLGYQSSISFANNVNGTTLVKDGNTTLLTISAPNANGQTTVDYQGNSLTLSNVETFSFYIYPSQSGNGAFYSLNLVNSVDVANKIFKVGANPADVTSAFSAANTTLISSDWVDIHDDLRSSSITGSLASDNLYWSGGNDSFNGGAGNDSAHLGNGLSYQSGISFATDVNGATLVKDGNTTLLTISAPNANGQTTVNYQGNSLTLSNVETFEFYASPSQSGNGASYSLNLSNSVDAANKTLQVGANTADVTSAFSTANTVLASSDWVDIFDDSRSSNITGSLARDNLYWSSGNDSFNGGAGDDRANLYYSLNYQSGISVATDANGATLVKDGNTTLVTISAPNANGQTTVNYQGNSLTLSNVETFGFYAYPSQGGNGASYSLNLGNSVDAASKTLQVGANTADVTSAFSAANTTLTSSDWVDIHDDLRSSSITGSLASDNLYWSGGNDSFNGGAGNDSAHLGHGLSYQSGISFATDVNGATLVKDGNTTLLTISAPNANGQTTVNYQGNSLTLSNVETFEFYASPSQSGNGASYSLNLSNSVDTANKTLQVGANTADVTSAFSAANAKLTSSDWVNIHDDFRNSSITGSVASDYLDWNGGNDSFNGGAGDDNAHLGHGLSYQSGISVATDANGTTLVKDGNITLVTISAPNANGQTTINYQGNSLTLSNVETFGFYAYPSQGGDGASYSLNLGNSVDAASKTLKVGADTADVTSAFSAANTTLNSSDWVNIHDDSRNSSITGSLAYDNLYWGGGNDSFNGGGNTDTFYVQNSAYLGVNTPSGALSTSVSNGVLHILAGGTDIYTVSHNADSSVTVQAVGTEAWRGTATLVGVEQLAYTAWTQVSENVMGGSNVTLNLADFSPL